MSGANLTQALLVEANLTNAKLTEALLSGGDLIAATLDSADLTGASLDAVDFSWASLRETKLYQTDLTLARFRSTNFFKTDFTSSLLDGTLFADVNLSNAVGLKTCDHSGPSTIDHITLQNSGVLPLRFLRGLGLPEALIMALPKIREAPGFFSCFISYSHKDDNLLSAYIKT